MWSSFTNAKPSDAIPVANFTKNKSPATIIFCPKNWQWHSKIHVKEMIADRKTIAAGDLFLVKLTSGHLSSIGFRGTHRQQIPTLFVLQAIVFHVRWWNSPSVLGKRKSQPVIYLCEADLG